MTFDDFITCYPITLNEQQKEAVRTVTGPSLLLAVPGSGKTTVIVARLGYMIFGCGIAPEKILTMTYTVAATSDMKKRFDSMFSEKFPTAAVEFKTINSVAVQIIGIYASRTGRTAFETAPEEEKSLYVRKAISNVLGVYPGDSDVKEVSSKITYVKNMLLSGAQIESLPCEVELFPKIYAEYQKLLSQSRKMDFDDQLVTAYTILSNVPDILSLMQNKYEYFNVDEAQDTSRVQHLILQLLASKKRNIFMVADDDQSLYSWRGAFPKALLDFDKTYPGARILKMETNFRSDGYIVEAADRLISKNLTRFEKHIRPTRAFTYKVDILTLPERAAQYHYIEKIAGSSQGETAVIYRYNESAIPIIDTLTRAGLPFYARQADTSFFSNKVIRDIRDIITLAYVPTDTEAFLRIYYKLSFYLKKDMATYACAVAKSNGIGIIDALQRITEGTELFDNITRISTLLGTIKSVAAPMAITVILENMGYRDYLIRSHISDRKVTILKALSYKVSSAMELIARLDELEKIMSSEEMHRQGGITLTSIHSSKGLEWENVYLIDCFDGYFPESIALPSSRPDEKAAFEEERRAYYVAVTRAKSHLCIFKYPTPCLFTKEFLGVVDNPIPARTPVPSWRPSFTKEKVPARDDRYEKFINGLKAGDEIEHEKFGHGKISTITDEYISILFGEEEKRFSSEIIITHQLIRKPQ